MPADILGTTVIDETAGAAARSFEFRKGPDLREHRARRRDQPRDAEDAERAARGDAGAPRHRRQADARARRAVLRPRDAEPARDGGHVPAARGAARSLLLQAPRRRSRAARSCTQILERTTGDATPKRARAVLDRERHPRDADARARRCPVARHVQDYAVRAAPGDAPRRAGRARHRASASSASAARRAARRRCSSPRRSARSSTGASRRAIDDVRAVGAPGAPPPRPPQLRGRGRGRQDRPGHRRDPQEPARDASRRRRAGRGRLSSTMGLLDVLPGVAPRRPRPRGDDDLFDDEFQRKLDYLALVSRRVFAGRMRAERRTKKSGSGVEFADHRDYQPGRRLPLPRLERLPALRPAPRPPLRGGRGPRHLLHRRHVARRWASATARSSATRSASRAALAYVGLANLDRVAHRHRRPTRSCERMPDDARQGAHLQGLPLPARASSAEGHDRPRRRDEDLRRAAQAPRPRRARQRSLRSGRLRARHQRAPLQQVRAVRRPRRRPGRGASPKLARRRPRLRLRDRRRARGHGHRQGARALRRGVRASTSADIERFCASRQVPLRRAPTSTSRSTSSSSASSGAAGSSGSHALRRRSRSRTLARDLRRRSPARWSSVALHPQAAAPRRSRCRSRSSGSASCATRRRRASSRSSSGCSRCSCSSRSSRCSCSRSATRARAESLIEGRNVVVLVDASASHAGDRRGAEPPRRRRRTR